MIDRHGSGGPYEDLIGYSRVVRAGEFYFTAGCTATIKGELVGIGDPYLQTKTALEVAVEALARAGCARQHVVTSRMYITDRSHADEVGRAHKDVIGDVRPAATMIVAAGFLNEQMLVEVELTGFAPRRG